MTDRRELDNTIRATAILDVARAVLNSGTCYFVDTGIPDVSAQYNAIITSIGNLGRYIEAESPEKARRLTAKDRAELIEKAERATAKVVRERRCDERKSIAREACEWLEWG